MKDQPSHEEINNHILGILGEVSEKLPEKYITGQQEHGGKLWEKNVGTMIYPELIDFIIYFHTYKAQVDKLIEVAKTALYEAKYNNPNLVLALQDALKPFVYGEIEDQVTRDVKVL